jgi:hypothetical protein
MEACYGGTDVMERSCAVARGKDINSNGNVTAVWPLAKANGFILVSECLLGVVSSDLIPPPPSSDPTFPNAPP